MNMDEENMRGLSVSVQVYWSFFGSLFLFCKPLWVPSDSESSLASSLNRISLACRLSLASPAMKYSRF